MGSNFCVRKTRNEYGEKQEAERGEKYGEKHVEEQIHQVRRLPLYHVLKRDLMLQLYARLHEVGE